MAGQLAFPLPPPPPKLGLIVDEVRLYATASPATAWWFEQVAFPVALSLPLTHVTRDTEAFRALSHHVAVRPVLKRLAGSPARRAGA